MLDIFVILFMLAGLFFFFGTTIGILRFPDFYCRTHAAGKGDTLSAMLMLLGLALYNLHHLSWGSLLVSGKIILIYLIIFIASPTATHAIMDAGYESKVRHWSRDDDDSTLWSDTDEEEDS